MTNTQFYIGIAIPSILVILGWLHQNVRLTEFRSDVDRRFEGIDRQFDRMDRRLILIENDQRQFFTITGKLDGRIDELHRK